MEQLNKVELRGNVGSVKIQSVADRQVAHLTLATNRAYKDKDGTPVIETTWHNIVAWEGRGVAELQKIERGSKLYVLGRIKNNSFIGSDGNERTVDEIVASRLVLLDESENLQCEL